jgi:hypothetical protein
MRNKWTPEYALEEPRFSQVVARIILKYQKEVEKNHRGEYRFKAKNPHPKRRHGLIVKTHY